MHLPAYPGPLPDVAEQSHRYVNDDHIVKPGRDISSRINEAFQSYMDHSAFHGLYRPFLPEMSDPD